MRWEVCLVDDRHERCCRDGLVRDSINLLVTFICISSLALPPSLTLPPALTYASEPARTK